MSGRHAVFDAWDVPMGLEWAASNTHVHGAIPLTKTLEVRSLELEYLRGAVSPAVAIRDTSYALMRVIVTAVLFVADVKRHVLV